jgi:spore maturation protein B
MISMLTIFSLSVIPLMITVIIVHGMVKKINVFDAFVEGAREGFHTAVRIMPYLVAIFIAIGLMRKSGAIDLLIQVMNPITTRIGIPSELLPLALMRPISGSGSLAILKDIVTYYGPDSFIGRTAATMMGSSETIFYTIAVYFGAAGIKNSRHTIPAALLSHFAAVIASIVICTILFA